MLKVGLFAVMKQKNTQPVFVRCLSLSLKECVCACDESEAEGHAVARR